MKVSIITVCFNAEKTIRDTIESVLAQDYPHLEYIIKDGGSTDNTLKIIESFGDKIHRLISKPDTGIYDAMNQGIQNSTGEIIGILNADDVYAYDSVLSDVVSQFAPESDALYSDLVYVKSDNLQQIVRKWISGEYNRNKFLNGWMPPHPTFFIRKKHYENYGLYRTDMKSAADYELMLRMLFKHQLRASYLPKTTIKMRVGGVSNSTLLNRLEANRDDRRAWKMNGLKPKWYTLYWKPLSKLKQFFR
jgi:glycosyltransferase involved in cell wall biosynthesis